MDSLLLLLGALVLALLLVFRLTLRHTRRRVRHHAFIGLRAERRGLALLERHGFTLVERQPIAELAVDVDGERLTFAVRADALVERHGRRFVAEVKGGDANASVESRATRRQLLEYAQAFGVSEVLLVDVPSARIHRVRFPAPAHSPQDA